MNKLITIGLVVAVVVGGGAFFGGMKYAESKSPRDQFSRQGLGANVGGAFGQDHGGEGAGRQFGGQRGGGFTAGEIISKDDKSVTIKVQDGGSKIIFLSDSTGVTKSSEGTLSDLEIGKNITVNGTANSDGSITAQSIQMRPNELSQTHPTSTNSQ